MTFLHHQGQLESPKMFNVGQPELQLIEGQLRIARWHLQCNELLSSTDLANGSSVQLTWLAQTLRRHTRSRVELLKRKTGGKLLGLADVMTGEAHQFCERFSYTDGLCVLSMKAGSSTIYSKKPSLCHRFYWSTIACHCRNVSCRTMCDKHCNCFLRGKT